MSLLWQFLNWPPCGVGSGTGKVGSDADQIIPVTKLNFKQELCISSM
jgi:hypothetical protein